MKYRIDQSSSAKFSNFVVQLDLRRPEDASIGSGKGMGDRLFFGDRLCSPSSSSSTSILSCYVFRLSEWVKWLTGDMQY